MLERQREQVAGSVRTAMAKAGAVEARLADGASKTVAACKLGNAACTGR
jgi:hypothetical protein